MSENAVRGKPFPPGVSGNLNGRPVGHRTRHQFSAAFAEDLAEVWAEHGKSSMVHTARSNPETFFAVCSKLVPRDVELTIRQNYSGGLDETDLQILRAIRDAIPNANELQPQAVLDHVLNALRAYDASPVIEMAQRLRAKTAKALIDIDLIIPAPIKSALGRPREDCRDALSQDSIRGNHCLAAESSLRGANYATH